MIYDNIGFCYLYKGVRIRRIKSSDEHIKFTINSGSHNVIFIHQYLKMGARPSHRYSVEVPNQLERAGETKVRRHPDYAYGLHECPEPELKTMQDILLHSFKKYADLNMLGRIIMGRNEDNVAERMPEGRELR